MKIALVHDYLLEAGGAERVLCVLSEMYPEAPIYTALAKNGTALKMLDDRRKNIVESKWAPFLKIGRFYSYFRFLLPWIWGSIDLTKYDLVITSCSGYIARGFKVRPDTKVVAYCHTPPRWLYGYDTPTGASAKWWGKMFMWVVGPFMRYFDYQSATRVDVWIANSKEVALRIKKFYRKNSTIIYPPVEFKYSRTPVLPYSSNSPENRNTGKPDDQYYLMISRIVGGKGIGEAAAAFKKLGIKLKIVGEVVDRKLGEQVESLGSPRSLRVWRHFSGASALDVQSVGRVKHVDRVDDKELAKLYREAKGFVALARDEDFGMTVVEAMVQGTPVLAFNGGGYRESVIDPAHQHVSDSASRIISKSEGRKKLQTGVLIDGTDTECVRAGIERMEKTKWDREAIKKWAGTFGRERFERELQSIVDRVVIDSHK